MLSGRPASIAKEITIDREQDVSHEQQVNDVFALLEKLDREMSAA